MGLKEPVLRKGRAEQRKERADRQDNRFCHVFHVGIPQLVKVPRRPAPERNRPLRSVEPSQMRAEASLMWIKAEEGSRRHQRTG